MEEDHERVQDGKMLHESSYKRIKKREVFVDESFKVDALDGEYIREIKLSSKMSKADKYQLLFYLFQLKKRGLHRKGLVSYTKEKKAEEVILTEEAEKEIISIIKDIKNIIKRPYPPQLLRKSYCRKCAYYDFCYADEKEDE